MTTLENIKIDYRSLRIGFCVREGNIQDILLASRLNTLLWGGAFNPIIPVGSADNLAEDLIKFFQIDLLIPVSESSEIKEFMDKYNWARFPHSHFSNKLISEDSFKKGFKRIRVLDISHILNKLWEKEFKFSDPSKSNCVLVNWKKKDPHSNIFSLLFGDYPSEKFSFDYKKKYTKLLRAKKISIENKKPIQPVLANMINPILLTEQDIESYGGSRNDSGIFVGDPNSFVDLLNFWNLRASGSSVSFFPKKNNARFISYTKKYINNLKDASVPGNRSLCKVWFTEKNKSATDEYKNIEKIITPLKLKKFIFGIQGISSHAWKNTRGAGYNLIKQSSCTASIGLKYGKPTFSFHLSGKPIFESKEYGFRDQYFAISLQPRFSFEFDDYTSDLPALTDLNEWYSRQMIHDPYALRVIKTHLGNSISVLTDITNNSLDFNLIPKIDLIKKIFERAGIKAKKSGAGLIAERIVSLMGGINGSARIFKIRGVRNFIKNTSPLNQKNKYQIEKAILDDGSFKEFENEFGLKGNSRPMIPTDVFDTMVEKNLLQVGTEVRCPKCSIKDWVNLKEISESYECNFCYEKNKFIDSIQPIELTCNKDIKKIDGVRWFYRLSGLFGRDDKQQGAIPVILILLHLSNRLHSSFGKLIYSTGIDLSYKIENKEVQAESDLFLMDLSEMMSKEDIEIVIGECKNGQRITKKQVDSLLEVKKLLEDSGIKCHLAFVKASGGFTQGEIKIFKDLYAKGIKPLLFTDKELEKWWNEYRDFSKNDPNFKLPVEHPFTFSDLAENSAYVYKLY
jgi:hypothetical protein